MKILEREIDALRIASVVAFIIFGISVISLLFTLTRLGKENNVYHRTVACILSVPLAERTDAYISQCYEAAEAKNDVEVDHYGNK